jgi:diguanylate cyclase (GGDEF)-like protein
MESMDSPLIWVQRDDKFYGYYDAGFEIHFDCETGLYSAVQRGNDSSGMTNLPIEPNSNPEELEKIVQEYFMCDSLTGAYNRRFMERFLENEVQKAQNSGFPLSLLMIDVDDFKRINDLNGHSVGDSVLRMMAAIIKNLIRPTDILARIGGDEFVIIMPGTNLEEAQVFLEKIKSWIKSFHFPSTNYNTHITVSIGAAGLEELELKEPDKLLHLADDRLYQAKWGRKNKSI